MLDTFGKEFSVTDRVQFSAGKNGLPRALLTHPSGSSTEVYLQGATVTSWTQPGRGELLYLSPQAMFAPEKAIRGGIPLIFPQFGGGPLPSHGFARNKDWTVSETGIGPQGQTFIALTLDSSPELKKVWPFDFQLVYHVELSNGLRTAMQIRNTGDSPFEFQFALHTYFAVSEIGEVDLPGLQGLTFLDNTKNRAPGSEDRSVIRFDGEIDRIYQASPSKLTLNDRGAGNSILIQKQGMKDSVVWNPWIEKARSLSDLPDEDYRKMVCVESGNMIPAVELAPHSTFECAQELWVQSCTTNGR